MDTETEQLFDELRHPGAALLLELLAGGQTEDALCGRIPQLSQSAINRKLQRLSDRRLVAREPGSKQQRGLRWHVMFPDETEGLLRAANELARLSLEARRDEAIETDERLSRTRDRRRLRAIGDA